MKKLVPVLAFVALTLGGAAEATELRPTTQFAAAVGLESGAVLPSGQINAAKIAILVQATANRETAGTDSLHAVVTLEERAGSHWRAIGSLRCPVGVLATGATWDGHGNSCEPTPITMRRRRGAPLRIAVNVRTACDAPTLCPATTVTHMLMSAVSGTPTPADLVPLNNGGSFDAALHLEADAVDSISGELNPERFAISVTARDRSGFVSVSARIEARADGNWTPIAQYVCDVGPLQTGETIIYRGQSCNPPNRVLLPAGTPLRVALSVSHELGATETVAVPIVIAGR